MTKRVIWHGSAYETAQLLEAISRNCSCRVDRARTLMSCAAHRMLVEDQRALDGLLFARHMARRLINEEFVPSPAVDSHKNLS